MKGTTKALISASMGIAILLLIGISGVFLKSGEPQVTFTVSQPVSPAKGQHQNLDAAIRSDADKAALQTYMDVAADMATDLQRPPQYVIAKADTQ
jgi:hypothetical protein